LLACPDAVVTKTYRGRAHRLAFQYRQLSIFSQVLIEASLGIGLLTLFLPPIFVWGQLVSYHQEPNPEERRSIIIDVTFYTVYAVWLFVFLQLWSER